MEYRRARVDGGPSFCHRQSHGTKPVSAGGVPPLQPIRWKHGHVSRAANWLYASIHRQSKAGMMGRDWGGGACNNEKRSSGKSLLQKEGFVIPEAVIGNQSFEKTKSSSFQLSQE